MASKKTRKRKRRPSLQQFVVQRLDEALRKAVADGSDIHTDMSKVVRSQAFIARATAASPQERLAVAGAYPAIFNAVLDKAGAATPAVEPVPGTDRFWRLPMFDEAARAFPGLASPNVGTRLKAASPEAMDFMLTAATEGIAEAADEARAETAAKIDSGFEPPGQHELAAWIATDCPPEVLRDVANRLAVLWDLQPGSVTVTGWAYGGFTTWRNGTEYHAPAGNILSDAKTLRRPNPLAPLLKAWANRPRPAVPNLRRDRMLPAKLAMIAPTHPRGERLQKLFSPAAHRRDNLVLPGFEAPDIGGPALPLALYGLGDDSPQRGGGAGAPLALRLFVEAVLAAPYVQRDAGEPVALDIPLRDLLNNLYPAGRKPRPNEYWPRLMRAIEALDSMDARVPWVDLVTGRGGLRRVVAVGDIPRGPGALDDNVRVVVDLPPGSGPGPKAPPTLGWWGAKSATAYNTLLNMSYRWFNPGVTRHPTGRGHWLQSQNPERYPALSDADVVAITRPLSARSARRNLVTEGWRTLRRLADAGELRIEGRRVLPPRE